MAEKLHKSNTAPLVACGLLLFGLTAGAEEPPEGAVLAELPFLDADEPNRIYLDLAPEGYQRRLRILLDTGATFSVFTPRAAREIGVRPRRLKNDPYRRPTALGRDLQFLIDDRRSDTASRTGREYGLLGGNFLADYVVEFDFPGHRVRFLDPDAWQVPASVEAPGEAVLEIDVVSSRPGLVARVNGRPLQLLFDTGAPFGLMLSGELADRAGISSAPAAGFGMWGVMGEADAEMGEVARFELGPFAFENVPVAVAPQGWFNHGLPGDSILGYDVMAQFVIRVDYARRRMWLKRDPEARMTLLGADASLLRRAGAQLVASPEGARTDFVLAGGIAQRRALRPGDLFRGLSPEQAVAALEGFGALVVQRRNGEAWTEVTLDALPEPADAAAGPAP